jgi:hypothetical protein
MSDSLNNSQMSKKSKKSKMSANENKENKENKENNNLLSSDNLQVPVQSVRAYLEETVTAAIQEGMMKLVEQKPENPLEFLGNFLIEKSKKK